MPAVPPRLRGWMRGLGWPLLGGFSRGEMTRLLGDAQLAGCKRAVCVGVVCGVVCGKACSLGAVCWWWGVPGDGRGGGGDGWGRHGRGRAAGPRSRSLPRRVYLPLWHACSAPARRRQPHLLLTPLPAGRPHATHPPPPAPAPAAEPAGMCGAAGGSRGAKKRRGDMPSVRKCKDITSNIFSTANRQQSRQAVPTPAWHKGRPSRPPMAHDRRCQADATCQGWAALTKTLPVRLPLWPAATSTCVCCGPAIRLKKPPMPVGETGALGAMHVASPRAHHARAHTHHIASARTQAGTRTHWHAGGDGGTTDDQHHAVPYCHRPA